MPNKRAFAFWEKNEALLKCPLCSQAGRIIKGSFVCRSNHCFDIASKGYINFAPGFRNAGYDRTLFESRQIIFESGFFKPIIDEIENIAATVRKESGDISILDAGCGEGYYAAAISASQVPGHNTNVIALDIEKDAILIATRRPVEAGWLVADIGNIPVTDSAVNLLLNVLTPANYTEFSRVLAPNGVIVKIIPGEDYLCEIREALSGRLGGTYSSERVIAHYAQNMKQQEIRDVRYRLPVTEEQRKHFFRMTPMTSHIDPASVTLPEITDITIHLKIIIGTKDTHISGV